MADVFLSYSRPDQRLAEQLAARIGEAGLSVWWDRHIEGGADFGTEIEREIQAARVVVVVWSASAVPSKWVRDEAAYARDHNKLIPVRIDDTLPPMGFRQLQAIDFANWAGQSDAPCFAALLRSLRRVLHGAPADAVAALDDLNEADHAASPAGTAVQAGLRSQPRHRTLAAGMAAAVALAAALGAITWLRAGPTESSVVADEVEIRPFTASPADPRRNLQATAYTEAFRTRFTEMGVRNVSAGQPGPPRSEFVLIGEITPDGDKEVLTTRLDDRATGATLWTARREPTQGAAWEATLAAYSISCASKRRDPARGPELLSRFMQACASFLDRDWQGFYAAAKGAYKIAPDDPSAIAFFAVGTAGAAYLQAKSRIEYARMMAEAGRLADEALRLDPKNPDAAFAKGMSFTDPQFEQQERWWRASINADLDTGMAYGRYSRFLETVGRLREAMDMALRSAHDRPNVLAANSARLFAAAGDWPQAQKLIEAVRVYNPASVSRSELLANVMYADVGTAGRMLNERAAATDPDWLACLEQVLDARIGRGHDAARFRKSCGGDALSPSLFALAGDVDGAFAEAEGLLRSNEVAEPPSLFGPEMHRVREDPRFWPLVARLGLTRYWLATDQWPDYCADEHVDCRAAARRAQDALNAATPSG